MRAVFGRHRRLLTGAAITVGFAGVAAAVAVSMASASPSPPRPVLGAQSAPSEVPSVTATGLAPFASPQIDAGIAPGRAILTSNVTTLEVFDSPDGAVTRTMAQYTRYSSPLTLMAIDDRSADGAQWYQVLLPAKPNGQTGWVRSSDVTATSTNTVVHVYLAEHELDLVVDGIVTLTHTVAVGSAATPTPLGTFYITDSIDLARDAGTAYGSYALGLSGYSEALNSFKGTLPQIAIHGTNRQDLIGQSVSNGCVRMRNDDVKDLATRVGLGTPVIVSASRGA